MWERDYTAPAFDTDAGVGAMQFMSDLFNKYKIASMTPPQNGFDNSKGAIQVTGTWMAGQYLSELKDDLGRLCASQKQSFCDQRRRRNDFNAHIKQCSAGRKLEGTAIPDGQRCTNAPLPGR